MLRADGDPTECCPRFSGLRVRRTSWCSMGPRSDAESHRASPCCRRCPSLEARTGSSSGRNRTCSIPINSRVPCHLATLEWSRRKESATSTTVPRAGIEPASSGSEPLLLPLEDPGSRRKLRRVDSNHDSELQRLAPLPLDDAGISRSGIWESNPSCRFGGPVRLPLRQSRARAVDGARTRTQRIKSPLLCHSSYDG